MDPNNPLAPPAGDIRNGGGTSGNAGYCIIALTKDSENEMWKMYLDEVKENDERITDTWKEDATGILVFVSLNLLISCSSQ